MHVLRLVFITILLTMVAVTTWASLGEHILQIPPTVTGDRWFIATLLDAYFGFTTFYLWVAYRSPALWQRIMWFMLIMALGNMAMAGYMLWRLAKLPPNASWSALLLRPEHQPPPGLNPTR
jgi:hypothetical protein